MNESQPRSLAGIGVLMGPDPDPIKPNESKGLYGKYIVFKSKDGTPLREPCFVLKATDPHAIAALKAYIEACQNTHPELARDLGLMVDHMLNYQASQHLEAE